LTLFLVEPGADKRIEIEVTGEALEFRKI